MQFVLYLQGHIPEGSVLHQLEKALLKNANHFCCSEVTLTLSKIFEMKNPLGLPLLSDERLTILSLKMILLPSAKATFCLKGLLVKFPIQASRE